MKLFHVQFRGKDFLKARAYLDKAIDLEHERRELCNSSDV